MKENIIIFDTKAQFKKFIKDKGYLKKINEGSEGECFLSLKEQKAYKILFQDEDKLTPENYIPTKIITTKDIDLNNFYLPEELYILTEKLLAYKTKYAPIDLFTFDRVNGNPNDLYKINFDILLKAYYKMLKEIEKLSQEQIKIYDLTNNLMFTGTELIGIDTCGYERIPSKMVDDTPLLEFNIDKLEDAIKEVFRNWLDLSEHIKEEAWNELVEEENIEKYIRKLKKQVKLSR